MTDIENKDINIIIVDDEEIVVSLVRDALEDDGFQIETASNGLEAIKIIKSKKIDLIICDIRMPKMDGIELVKNIREEQPDIAVIFMTGYANLNSAKDAIKQGAFDYILKPFELNEIRQAVNKAIEIIKKKKTQAKNSGSQLDHLSDLHQMLFSVGDKKSLVTTSLKFAMMHCKSKYGAVLYWNSNKTNFYLTSINEQETTERELPEEMLFKSLDSTYLWEFQEPLMLTRIEDHPLYKANPDPELEKYILPSWKNKDEAIVIMPVSRTYSIYGLLMVSAKEHTTSTNDPNLKFLTITAHQLAMSLENLELLEEAQKAYVRLKELQDETIQLEKMATRGEMSAEIGHELNNFLGVVAGNLSLLEFQLKKKNYDELEKYVVAMTDNIGKIKNFTSNLMDLRPISSQKEIIYFDKLMQEVIDYLKPQRRFQGVNINLIPMSEAIPFMADTVHIQQLLYNMFNNAADATEGCETKEITVSAGINPDNETFNVTIKDTGIGIEPELIEKVFKEKFTTKEKGHGFGLLVCKRIIDSHNGTLDIESTPGKGTSIKINFPLSTQEKQIASTT